MALLIMIGPFSLFSLFFPFFPHDAIGNLQVTTQTSYDNLPRFLHFATFPLMLMFPNDDVGRTSSSRMLGWNTPRVLIKIVQQRIEILFLTLEVDFVPFDSLSLSF